MIDQAANLRKIMNSKLHENPNNLAKKRAKVLSISSGKGGVGKTSISINFAISLKRLGYEVLIIDADIGLANIEILSGISLSTSISDVIYSNKDIFDIMGNGPENIKIISGGTGLREVKLLEGDNLIRFVEEIDKLQNSFDFIIIDTGAGVSRSVIDFIMTSDDVIVVCTPDPTSLMDSYTLIKAINSIGYPGKISIVTNQVNNREEGRDIFQRILNATNNFLKIDVDYLGYVERSKLVPHSIREQTPFMVSHPNHPLSKKINILTMNFLRAEDYQEEKDNTNFAKRLLSIFTKWGD